MGQGTGKSWRFVASALKRSPEIASDVVIQQIFSSLSHQVLTVECRSRVRRLRRRSLLKLLQWPLHISAWAETNIANYLSKSRKEPKDCHTWSKRSDIRTPWTSFHILKHHDKIQNQSSSNLKSTAVNGTWANAEVNGGESECREEGKNEGGERRTKKWENPQPLLLILASWIL